MTQRMALTWDKLPPYATDEAIGEAVLGRDHMAQDRRAEKAVD